MYIPAPPSQSAERDGFRERWTILRGPHSFEARPATNSPRDVLRKGPVREAPARRFNEYQPSCHGRNCRTDRINIAPNWTFERVCGMHATRRDDLARTSTISGASTSCGCVRSTVRSNHDDPHDRRRELVRAQSRQRGDSAPRGSVSSGSAASISVRRASSQGGKTSRSPRRAGSSSTPKPGPSVASSKRTPPGSRK